MTLILSSRNRRLWGTVFILLCAEGSLHGDEFMHSEGEERPEWLDSWRDWTELSAVRNGKLFFIPPDLMQRHTPRALEGAQRLCAQIESVRETN